MPPRLNLLAAPRTVALRPRSAVPQWRVERLTAFQPAICRTYADSSKDLPKSTEPKGPNTDTLPHVSEEARDVAKVMGEQGPDVEQGTPVEDVIRGDKEAAKHLPKVMRDSLKTDAPKGTRSYSTTAIRREEVQLQQATPTEVSSEGLKFSPVVFPLPTENRLKSRYDPVVEQVTNLLMQDGKLSVAQRNMSVILNHLRTAPPPSIDPRRPLLPGSPPPSHLPLNPVLYLTLAVDSVAPLMRIRSQRGAAGGGVALQIPVPLGQRQRRRAAMQWILEAASKRRSKVTGKTSFATRVADELIAVVQGTSSVWERRGGVHKIAVAARANLNFKPAKGKK